MVGGDYLIKLKILKAMPSCVYPRKKHPGCFHADVCKRYSLLTEESEKQSNSLQVVSVVFLCRPDCLIMSE